MQIMNIPRKFVCIDAVTYPNQIYMARYVGTSKRSSHVMNVCDTAGNPYSESILYKEIQIYRNQN